ncbi:MAG TPA: response regulator [Candidatus Saccharimonadales bacterium]|nr:response regulator [Candidatus Saccharimonadales bacterium]
MGKIVFCEDDPMIQMLIRAAFKSSDHSIFMAPDGREGLALIERELPDVVFSDVSMPNLDGFQLGDALKAAPATAGIPVIFMTASVQRAQIDEALRHGAAGVLPKPFTMAALRARVDEFAKPAAGAGPVGE